MPVTRRLSLAVGGALTVSAVVLSTVGASQAPASSASSAAATVRPVLDRYCIRCHNARLKTAGLVLDNIDMTDIGAHADVWEKVIRKVGGGAMPPVGNPRPDAPAAAALVSWLEKE